MTQANAPSRPPIFEARTTVSTPRPLSAPLTIGSHVTLGAMRSPEKIAIAMIDGPAQTYRELDLTTNRFAHALLGAGIEPGERVAIWMENRLEYLDAYLACLKSGHIVVQINIRHTAYEAQYQLENSGATVLVFDDAVAERVEKLDLGDQLRLLVTTGEDRVGGAVRFSSFIGAASAAPVVSRLGPEDLAVIGYTSGTTGFPKGAELTHRSIRTLGVTNAFTNRYVMQSTQIFPLSMSFTAGIPAHLLTHLYVGGTSHIMKEWDTERLVDAIDEHHATFTIMPSPPIVQFCEAVRARGTRLDSLVSVLHSTAKAPEEHLELLVDTIGPRLVEGWGMTENSGGLAAATTAGDYIGRQPGIFSSTGRAAPDTVVRVLDDEGNILPDDGSTVGQLVFHSGSIARGYWQNPEATAKSFVDGWYHSGDLGHIDPDGYVTILDRRNDLVLSGGMNVYPSEIERILIQIDGIDEVAVIAGPHERWGQTPVAFVRRGSVPVSVDGILAFSRERLAAYKLPTDIRFVDTLPKNASGKVLKHELRAILETEA